MTEDLAARILIRAVHERKAAELFTTILNGGTATLDHDNRLILVDKQTVELFTTL